MLEVSNGLRYVPVAKALKEHRPIKVRLHSICNGNVYFAFFSCAQLRKTLTRKQQFIIVPPVTSEGLSF